MTGDSSSDSITILRLPRVNTVSFCFSWTDDLEKAFVMLREENLESIGDSVIPIKSDFVAVSANLSFISR